MDVEGLQYPFGECNENSLNLTKPDNWPAEWNPQLDDDMAVLCDAPELVCHDHGNVATTRFQISPNAVQFPAQVMTASYPGDPVRLRVITMKMKLVQHNN